MSKVFTWSGPKRAVSAEKVANHLQKLEDQHGKVTRELFLDSARPEDSDMHPLFEWDDEKAAEKYRLQQASIIISSIRVTVVEEETKPVTVHPYVQTDTGSSVYINIDKAMSDEDERQKVIRRACAEMKWFISKYNAYVEFAELIDLMEKICEKEEAL